jgi:hypothetical protein
MHLTASLPGTGGLLKAAPEDFVVEELPAYPATGEGGHTSSGSRSAPSPPTTRSRACAPRSAAAATTRAPRG